MLFSLLQLHRHLLQQTSHSLLAVKHTAGLLVALDIILNFSLQVLVNSLVFEDAEKALIYLTVQHLVLVSEFQVLLSKVLPLESRLV